MLEGKFDDVMYGSGTSSHIKSPVLDVSHFKNLPVVPLLWVFKLSKSTTPLAIDATKLILLLPSKLIAEPVTSPVISKLFVAAHFVAVDALPLKFTVTVPVPVPFPE